MHDVCQDILDEDWVVLQIALRRDCGLGPFRADLSWLSIANGQVPLDSASVLSVQITTANAVRTAVVILVDALQVVPHAPGR
jgi:hypothetical protein